MKNTPGPLAPLFRSRPSLKMTALSYSWTIDQAIIEAPDNRSGLSDDWRSGLIMYQVKSNIYYRLYYNSPFLTSLRPSHLNHLDDAAEGEREGEDDEDDGDDCQ